MASKHSLLSLAILACILRICFAQTHQEEANARANEGALKLIANLPRAGGTSELDEAVIDEPQEYVKGIISLVIIPAVFVALSVALCPVWTICRCCKCCCCKKNKPNYAITKCQIYFRFFIVLGCVIAMVAMAAIAYGANVDFSGSLLYNEGEGVEGNLLGEIEELMMDGVNKTNQIINIANEISDGLVFTVDSVQSILSDTSILSVGSSTLIAMLNSISMLWSDYNVTTSYNSENYTFPCEFCTTIGSTIGNITMEVDAQITPIFADLNDTVNGIGSSLVDTETDILEQIDSFLGSVGELNAQFVDGEDTVRSQRPDMENYNDQRELAYNIIFAFPLLPIIFILFGGILKKPICFTLSYVCLWFSCTMMWLLLAVHLPIAVLLNDACNFIEMADDDVAGVINGTNGVVLQACLDNERLTETFGLGGPLNFSDSIQFHMFGNMTENFQFGDLILFEDDALSTNFTTFYVKGDAALLTINNLTSSSPFANDTTYYDRSNVMDLNSTEYYPFNSTLWQSLETLKDGMVAESLSISAFNSTLYKIRANLSAVTYQVQSLESNVEALANSVENVSYLMAPLLDTVDELIEEGRCGFVGDAYRDTKAVMCAAVLGSLSRIVVAMFVIAILSLFGCMFAVCLVRKVHWFQVQKQDDKEKKLQQSFQPNRPNVVVMQPLMQNGGYQPGGNIAPSQPMYYNQTL
eukprot:267979_1